MQAAQTPGIGKGRIAVLVLAILLVAHAGWFSPARAQTSSGEAADYTFDLLTGQISEVAPNATGSLAGQSLAMPNGLNVYVGYANIQDNASFPNPWQCSQGVVFIGQEVDCNGAYRNVIYDTGAIRIDNPTNSSVVISSISVDLPGAEGTDYGQRPVHFDQWPKNITIQAGGMLILTEVANVTPFKAPIPVPRGASSLPNLLFDTSDYNVLPHLDPFTGLPNCVQQPSDGWHDPVITIAAGGNIASWADRSRTLDWGGIDPGSFDGWCELTWQGSHGARGGNFDPQYESRPWTLATPVEQEYSGPLTLTLGPNLGWSYNGSNADGAYSLSPLGADTGPTVGLPTRLYVDGPADGTLVTIVDQDGTIEGSGPIHNGIAIFDWIPRSSGAHEITSYAGSAQSNTVIVTV